jgi:UDP-glucose:(heptosyl)LPS alpha-1,3-glucosyltransferase
MRLAFSLHNDTSTDGIQNDCRTLLEECARRGHICRLYCREWDADTPQGVEILKVPAQGLSRAAKRERFNAWLQAHRVENPVDGLVGFDPVSGLDIYVASDLSTDEAKPKGLQRRKEYRQKLDGLRAISKESTSVLLHSGQQKEFLEQQFDIQSSRTYVLPGGFAPDWQPPDKLRERRKSIRAELEIEEGEFVLLFAAADLESGGFDRALAAFTQIRFDQPGVKSRLLVIGDDEKNVLRRVKRAELAEAVTFLETWAGVENAMCASDALIHPAREDHRGELPLKSLAMGLPVVTTEACATSAQVLDAKAGLVLASPFDQAELNKAAMRCIDGIYRADFREAGQLYAGKSGLGEKYKVAVNLIESLCS